MLSRPEDYCKANTGHILERVRSELSPD